MRLFVCGQQQTNGEVLESCDHIAHLKEISMSNKTTSVAAAATQSQQIAAAKAATSKVVNKAFGKSMLQQLDELTARRQEWESTDYKKANEGLYALLRDCLVIYKQRFEKANDNEKKALRRQLIERLTAAKVRVVKTSTTLTMLTRYVFNADRKRAQGYGNVLAAAVQQNISVEGFEEWVISRGGIEEIKRQMVKKPEALAKQEAVKTAATEVKGSIELNTLQPLAHVRIEGLSGTYSVLLAKPNPSGGADSVGTLSKANDALVNALITRMAKEVVEQAQADKELAKQVKAESSSMLGGKAKATGLKKVVNG
jgi:IS1 family transposase